MFTITYKEKKIRVFGEYHIVLIFFGLLGLSLYDIDWDSTSLGTFLFKLVEMFYVIGAILCGLASILYLIVLTWVSFGNDRWTCDFDKGLEEEKILMGKSIGWGFWKMHIGRCVIGVLAYYYMNNEIILVSVLTLSVLSVLFRNLVRAYLNKKHKLPINMRVLEIGDKLV